MAGFVAFHPNNRNLAAIKAKEPIAAHITISAKTKPPQIRIKRRRFSRRRRSRSPEGSRISVGPSC